MSVAIRSECLWNKNFQTAFVIAICPPAQTRIPKRARTLCDRRHSGLCDQSTHAQAVSARKKATKLGGLVKEKENSRSLCHEGAAHNLNNTISVGTLI
jgi:hypothetical protein